MELLEEAVCIHLKAAQLELPGEMCEAPRALSIFSTPARRDARDADGTGADMRGLDQDGSIAQT